MEIAIYHDQPEKKKKATNEGRGLGKARIEEELVRDAGQESSAQVNVVEQVAPLGEVMVRVVRIPANPRLLICESQESECRRILVRVRSNVKFRRGMKFAAVPSGSESEPWSYSGAMPRHAGRW
jgi:hypothetical protein